MEEANGARLRVVDGSTRRVRSGDEVLAEGARILGRFLTRQLPLIPEDDPHYDAIAADASRLTALAALRSPRKPAVSPS